MPPLPPYPARLASHPPGRIDSTDASLFFTDMYLGEYICSVMCTMACHAWDGRVNGSMDAMEGGIACMGFSLALLMDGWMDRRTDRWMRVSV